MAMPQLDPSKLQLVQELEIEMMSDMYNRLTSACHKKCIPPKYHEVELGMLYAPSSLIEVFYHYLTLICRLSSGKGESVCLDRCVAKYLDIHERIGKKLSSMSMQEEEAAKKTA